MDAGIFQHWIGYFSPYSNLSPALHSRLLIGWMFSFVEFVRTCARCQ